MATLDDARAQAIANDLCCSKKRLKDEFRVKPKPNAVPVRWYSGDYGRYPVYRVADCIPMRERTSASRQAISPKQGQRLGLMAKLRSHAATASRLAQVWFSDIHDRQVVLDTETTGLGSDAQIIEIAIIDITGVVLLHRRIKPSVAVEDDAADIHGITLEQLKNAPTWPEVVDDVRQVLQGKTVIIYNADFDMRLLCQTSIAYRLTTGWITEIKTRCAMQLASQFFRASCDSNRWISLKRAMSLAGLAWTGNAHSAVADTQATLTLINYIENHERQILRQLEALNNP